MAKCFKKQKLSEDGQPVETPKQQIMIDVVPGTQTDLAVVVGSSPIYLTADVFTEKDLSERARFCKDGMHFTLGGDKFFTNAGTASEFSPPMSCCQMLSKNTCCCIAGSFTSTSRHAAHYQSIDASKEKIVFEDQWDQNFEWSCCSLKTTNDYKILTKRSEKVIGGIKFRQEGSRQCCGCTLMGLPGQEGGEREQFAWAFQGDEPTGPPKDFFGSYQRTGIKAQKCGDCISTACCISLLACCPDFNLLLAKCCPCCAKWTKKKVAGEYSCKHKRDTWGAKVPNEDGSAVNTVFWQVKAEPAQFAHQYLRPVSVMSPDEGKALVALSILPHAHTSQFKLGTPNARAQLLPTTRNRYGLGWSTAFKEVWKTDCCDAVELTTADQPKDIQYKPKCCEQSGVVAQ